MKSKSDIVFLRLSKNIDVLTHEGKKGRAKQQRRKDRMKERGGGEEGEREKIKCKEKTR